MAQVIKANGDKEEFSEEKLRNSIQRAGIPKEIQETVVAHVKDKLHPNITTHDIYKHVNEFLAEKQPLSRSRYGLKQALMELGPTGYPFEDFIARILQTQGFKTQVRQILAGKCVTHEIDVLGEKGSQKIMVEAKYHNMSGTKTNIHVAMYTKARFNDVIERNNVNEAWLITNTKVTTDAITYALCMGMKIISWNYPEEGSLRELVEKSGLIPITALVSLSEQNKQKLIQHGVIFSIDLCKEENLSLINLSQNDKDDLLSEISFTCQIPSSASFTRS